MNHGAADLLQSRRSRGHGRHLMRIADDVRTHTVEDVSARLIDMVADKLLDRALAPTEATPAPYLHRVHHKHTH